MGGTQVGRVGGRRGAGWLAWMAVWVCVAPVGAQLAPAGAAQVGIGDADVASARGIAAIRANPAGLALSTGVTATLLSVTVGSGLAPVTLGDLADREGTRLSDATRAAWLDRITAAGGQRGEVGVEVAGVSVSVGSLALQFSTVGTARATLGADAAELLLYGNAGREGEPRDFDLAGSRLDAVATSSVALGWGRRVGDRLSLGVTGKYLIGHGVLVGRDAGSRVGGDPVEFELDFPVILNAHGSSGADAGRGIALDVGAHWRGDGWSAGAVVHNLVETFSWDLRALSWRPGRALFDGRETTSDFEPRPAIGAPGNLRRALDAIGPRRQIALGGAWEARPDLRLLGAVRGRFGEGIDAGSELEATAAAEWTGVARLPLGMHLGVTEDGFRLGGRATLRLGPVHLSVAGAYRTGEVDRTTGALSLTLGGY